MRTLVNTIERLGNDYDFRVVTRDHDGKSDKTPYTSVRINDWNTIGPAKVRYVSKDRIKLGELQKIITEVDPDAIYSNSYFSTFTIMAVLLRRFRKINGLSIIVAPEGELTPASLRLKRAKKKPFVSLSSALGLYDGIIWRTSSEIEASQVRRLKVKRAKIFVAPNMPPKSIFPSYDQAAKRKKGAGILRLVYLSRIHPVKNLAFLLSCLKKVSGRVALDVYGPIDADAEYVDRCMKAIAELPPNITVVLKGGVENERVPETLFQYEFFTLPSISESFGHVFLEALAAGCPLIISDRTPWRDLKDLGVGWDLSLESPERWIETIEKCVEMSGDEYSAMSARARTYAEEWLADEGIEQATRNVIEFSLGRMAVP